MKYLERNSIHAHLLECHFDRAAPLRKSHLDGLANPLYTTRLFNCHTTAHLLCYRDRKSVLVKNIPVAVFDDDENQGSASQAIPARVITLEEVDSVVLKEPAGKSDALS
jgi:hypothetical protein